MFASFSFVLAVTDHFNFWSFIKSVQFNKTLHPTSVFDSRTITFTPPYTIFDILRESVSRNIVRISYYHTIVVYPV